MTEKVESTKEVEKKEHWIEWLSEMAALWAALATAATLLYTFTTDLYSARNHSLESARERAVISLLRQDLRAGASIADLQKRSKISEEDLDTAISKLISEGLVSVRSDGKYQLSTTEYSEISTRLEESAVALNGQIQKVQEEVKALEEERNRLLTDGNNVQAELASIGKEQTKLLDTSNKIQEELVDLRKQTNLIAVSYDETLKRNNVLLDKNVAIVEQTVQAASKYMAAVNVLLLRNQSLTQTEKALLTKFTNSQVTVSDLPAIYQVLHKYFPTDFEKPSEKPFENLKTPEMKLFMASIFSDPGFDEPKR